MAAVTWTFDIPSGVWKNHVLSSKLRSQAIANTVVAQHAIPEKAFGRKSGESVTITRIHALAEPVSPEFGENTLIPEEGIQTSTSTITIKQIGRAVVFTSDVEVLNEYDMEDPLQRVLREQMELSLDTMAANAFKSTKIKYAITGPTSGVFTNNGTFGATSTDNLNTFHLEELRDYLFDTLKAPMVNNKNYFMIARTRAVRGILRDPDYEKWFVNTDPQRKMNHEIGEWEGIRIIETNHDAAFKNVGSGGVLGEAVIFGADAVALVEALPPELRMEIPRNFGLLRGVAWYGRLNFGLYNDIPDPGFARVIHIGSA